MREPFVLNSHRGEVLLELEGLFFAVRFLPPLPNKTDLERLLARQASVALVRLGEWVGLLGPREALWVEADEAWFEELISTLKEHGPLGAEERAEEALLSKKVANAESRLGKFLEEVRTLQALWEDKLREAQELRNYGRVARLASWLERLVQVRRAGEEVATLWEALTGEPIGLGGGEVSTWKEGGARERKSGRGLRMEARRGGATPQTTFRLPILRTLRELGGQARAAEVLEGVYAKVKHILKEADLEPAVADRAYEPLWKNRARWEAARLKKEGLLASVETGLWAITEKGRAYLEAQDDYPSS